jgi:hypothetical protein
LINQSLSHVVDESSKYCPLQLREQLQPIQL